MAYEIIQLNSNNSIIQQNTAYGIDLNFNSTTVFTSVYDNLQQARANLKNLLQTVPRDRYYHPTFGCNLMSGLKNSSKVVNRSSNPII